MTGPVLAGVQPARHGAKPRPWSTTAWPWLLVWVLAALSPAEGVYRELEDATHAEVGEAYWVAIAILAVVGSLTLALRPTLHAAYIGGALVGYAMLLSLHAGMNCFVAGLDVTDRCF